MAYKVQLPPFQQNGRQPATSGSPLCQKAGTSGTPRRAPDESARRERVRAVLNALTDLPGESEWLEHHQPDVWNHCIALLRGIDAAWFSPINEFDEALRLFEIAFKEARELYRPHPQKPPQGVLENVWAVNGRREG
jgi:hypothetical protein